MNVCCHVKRVLDETDPEDIKFVNQCQAMISKRTNDEGTEKLGDKTYAKVVFDKIKIQ